MSSLKYTPGYTEAKNALKPQEGKKDSLGGSVQRKEYSDQTLQDAFELLEGASIMAAVRVDPRVALELETESPFDKLDLVRALSAAAYDFNNLSKVEKCYAATRAEELALEAIWMLSQEDQDCALGWHVVGSLGSQALLLRLLQADTSLYLRMALEKHPDQMAKLDGQEETWVALGEELGWVVIHPQKNEAAVMLENMWKLGFPTSPADTVLFVMAELNRYKVRFHVSKQTYSELLRDVATNFPRGGFVYPNALSDLEKVLGGNCAKTLDPVSELALMEYSFEALSAVNMDSQKLPAVVHKFMQDNETLVARLAALKALGAAEVGKHAYLLAKDPIEAIKELQSMSGELSMIRSVQTDQTGGWQPAEVDTTTTDSTAASYIPLFAEFASFDEYLAAEQEVVALNNSGELDSVKFVLLDTTLGYGERIGMPRSLPVRQDVEQVLHMLSMHPNTNATDFVLNAVGVQMKLVIKDSFADWQKLAAAAWPYGDIEKILRSIYVNYNQVDMVTAENCLKGTRWLLKKANLKNPPKVNPDYFSILVSILLRRACETKVTPGSLLDKAVRGVSTGLDKEQMVALCNANRHNLLLPANALNMLLDQAHTLTEDLREEMVRLASQQTEKVYTEEVLSVLRLLVSDSIHSQLDGADVILDIIAKMDAEFPWEYEGQLAAELVAKLLHRKYGNDYKAWMLADEMLDSWQEGSLKDLLESVDAVL